MARHERGDPVGGDVAAVHLDPSGEARVGGELLDAAAALAPHLPGDGEREVGDVEHGVEEQVDALVVAHDAEGEQPRGPGGVDVLLGLTARQVRREVELAHVPGAELGRELGLRVRVHDNGVHAARAAPP